jgi:hypothetical protein
MKTRTLEMTRRGAASALFAALLPVAIALPLVSGCATDDAETDTASQGLGATCTILRPVGWSVGATPCHEFTIPVNSPPIQFLLADGLSATFDATPGGGFGRGQITLQCQNGVPRTVHATCAPLSGGGGGGDF